MIFMFSVFYSPSLLLCLTALAVSPGVGSGRLELTNSLHSDRLGG